VANQALDIDMLKELARGTSDPGASAESRWWPSGRASGFPSDERAASSASAAPRSAFCVVPPDAETKLQAASPGHRPGQSPAEAGGGLPAPPRGLGCQPQAHSSASGGMGAWARPVRVTETRWLPGTLVRLRAGHPSHVWAIDSQFDATADGERLKLVNIVDEHTREAAARAKGQRAGDGPAVGADSAFTPRFGHVRMSNDGMQ
jgi:hypothetical protein